MKSAVSRIVAAASVAAVASVASATLLSPGFELGPAVSVYSFPPTPNAAIWIASNTDGERILSTVAKPAAEGQYYASLLQNAGQTNRPSPIFANYGFTGFDRIYNTFSVQPNTTYVISFQHAADDRFGYLGANTLVEVQSVDTLAMFASNSYVTPGLFNWTLQSFQFTTDAGTTTAAIAFSPLGSGSCSVVIDDVRVIPEPATVLGLLLGVLALRRGR